MTLAEGVKLQMCCLLHHLLDNQLRHRVEAIVNFSHDFVGEIQVDQLRRYVEIKQSDLPSAVAAKKTREFRCPPVQQMNAILGFKNMPEEERENCPCNEELAQIQTNFHSSFTSKLLHKMAEEELTQEEPVKDEVKHGLVNRMMNAITLAKKNDEETVSEENVKSREQIFRRVLIKTIVSWAQESVSSVYFLFNLKMDLFHLFDLLRFYRYLKAINWYAKCSDCYCASTMA